MQTPDARPGEGRHPTVEDAAPRGADPGQPPPVMITRWTGREAHELGRALRMTVEGFAEYLGVSRRAVEKWRMLGQRTVPRPDIQAALDTALQRAPAEAKDRFRLALALPAPERASAAPEPGEPPSRRPDSGEELVRHAVQRSMSRQGLVGRELDDWERLLAQHERRARSRPADVELADLLSDAHEVSRHLERPQTSSATRRLTRLVGRLARLIGARLDETGQRAAARRWAQIARVAAVEADGPPSSQGGTVPSGGAATTLAGDPGGLAPGPVSAADDDPELLARPRPLAGSAESGAAAVGPATPRDVPGLAALVAEREGADGDVDLDPIQDDVSALLDRPDSVRALVARVDDEVAGLASYALVWPAGGRTRSLHLHELYVVRAQRDRGVGRSLVVALAQLARAEGCSRIEWTTRRDDERARDVSLRLGAVGQAATRYEVALEST